MKHDLNTGHGEDALPQLSLKPSQGTRGGKKKNAVVKVWWSLVGDSSNEETARQ
jgi:hypothetical protein